MVEPREGIIRAPDGRTIAYRDYGDAGAAPVVFHHGTPGSRLAHHPDPGIYGRTGVRLIAFDRPGYGGSDARAGRAVADVALDVLALADALGRERFGIFGVSGGGPHALATAALLPERVTRVAVHVGPAPSDDPDFDFMEGMNELNRVEFGAALEGREPLAAVLEPWVEELRSNSERVVDEIAATLPQADQASLADPRVRAVMAAAMHEAVRQGPDGWIDDDLAFVRPWGFAPEAISVPVRLWQGEADVLVPRAQGDYLASRIPGATFELIAGMGHMLLDWWDETLLWLAES